MLIGGAWVEALEGRRSRPRGRPPARRPSSPLAGGTSVAFVGGLGALAVLGRDTTLTRFRVQALVAIPLAILDTVLGDIHGAPYLVCFAIGAVWVVREERVVAARGKRSSRPDRRGRSWA